MRELIEVEFKTFVAEGLPPPHVVYEGEYHERFIWVSEDAKRLFTLIPEVCEVPVSDRLPGVEGYEEAVRYNVWGNYTGTERDSVFLADRASLDEVKLISEQFQNGSHFNDMVV